MGEGYGGDVLMVKGDGGEVAEIVNWGAKSDTIIEIEDNADAETSCAGVIENEFDSVAILSADDDFVDEIGLADAGKIGKVAEDARGAGKRG